MSETLERHLRRKRAKLRVTVWQVATWTEGRITSAEIWAAEHGTPVRDEVLHWLAVIYGDNPREYLAKVSRSS